MSDPNEVLAEISDALTSVNVAAYAVKKLSQDARSVSELSGDIDWFAEHMQFVLTHMRDMAQAHADMYNRRANAEIRREFEREV